MPITPGTLRLEQELRDELAKITDREVRTMVTAWARAWDEIAPDLGDSLEQLLADGNTITRNQLLRSVRLRKALDAIAVSLDDLITDSKVSVTGQLRSVIDAAGSKQARLIATQLPAAQDLVDLDAWSRVDSRQISAIVKRSTQQITSLTKPLSLQSYAAVQGELVRGVLVGSNPRETARRILVRSEHAFNGGLSRAITIARTETLDAHRAGAQLGQEQHTDVLTGWTWLATMGPRTCPACWGMNGTFHELTESGPDGHQNCRCARLPATKPWKDLGIRAKEPKSLLPDPDEAFARMTPAQQQGVLGPRGYAAWKAGKFPRSAWATRRTNTGWRDSFVPAKPPKVTAAPKKAPVGRPKKTTPAATSGPGRFDQIPKINPELLANMKRRDIDVGEWNQRATNPLNGTDPAYGVNCQRVVQAYEMRARGYDVTAKPNPYDGSDRASVFLKWADGVEQRMTDSGRYLVSLETKRLVDNAGLEIADQMITDAEKYVTQVVDSWPEGARGWVMFYRSGKAGHIFNIDRTAAGAVVREAQVQGAGNLPLSYYMNQVRLTRRRNGTVQLEGHGVLVARVDDLDFNDGVLEAITWTS